VTTSCCARCIVFEIWQQKRFKQSYLCHTLHRVWYLYPQFILYTEFDICTPSLYSTQSLISVPPVYTLHRVWYLYPQFILYTEFDICTPSLYSTQSLIYVPPVYTLHRVWYMYPQFILYTNIQYWCIDGKNRIYVARLRNGGKDELLASLSIRFVPSHANSIFTVNAPILYLSCNIICQNKCYSI
jgi:hypothetical protein